MSKIKSQSDLLASLVTQLRQAATNPTIHKYVPHPKQEEFHTSTAKGRAFLGGNRSGKTVGGATELVWWATGTHPYIRTPPPPVRLRVVAVDYLNGVAKIVLPEVAKWMPPSVLKGGSWETAYSKELRTLYLENGSFIEFMSYDQDLDKFAGTSRHAIWFDEEPPKSIFDECLMRLVDTGGSWWLTMTPVNGMTWVYDSIFLESEENANPDVKVVIVHSVENPYINENQLSIITSGLSEDDKKARLRGEFVASGGLIYKDFSQEKHVYEWRPPEKGLLWVAGMDHGLTNPTCFLWAQIDREGRIFVFDEHYVAGEIVSWHAQRVHSINSTYGRVPDYYVGDPSIRNRDPITGTSVLIEYVDNGIPIVLGNNDQKAGIDRILRMLKEDKLFISDRCVNLIREMKRLRWATWANKKVDDEKNKKEEQHKKNDHACDALRYLVASRPMFDDATTIPQPNFELVEASRSVSPYGQVVGPEYLPVTKRNVDYHMGEDF